MLAASGYERFFEIIADPDDPEFEETIRWCGGHFDPEWFDLAMTDKDLRKCSSVECQATPVSTEAESGLEEMS